MLSTRLKTGSALLCMVAITANSGCAQHKAYNRTSAVAWKGMKYGQVPRIEAVIVSSNCRHDYANRKPHNAVAPRTTSERASTGDMPPHAKPGECYARVYVPPEFDTVTKRVCVREKSERIEIIPAMYNWVEERVLVKEAATELVEVPAKFYVQDHIVQTSPGHSTWIKADQVRCVADTHGPHPQDIFCLVAEPPTTVTIQTERLVEGPKVKTIIVPAEYQMVRKQKLVRPPCKRTVTVPAEFREFEETVMVTPGRMEWQRVDCDSEAMTLNKEVLQAGYRNP